jgi:hypothetical protein
MKTPRIVLALARIYDAIADASKPPPCQTCKQKLGTTWDCKECDQERADTQTVP